jgi:2-oxo-hept-3-ene-1,7-dioate hydratase
VILGGSFTRPTTAVAGDTLQADDAPLGTVSFHFV